MQIIFNFSLILLIILILYVIYYYFSSRNTNSYKLNLLAKQKYHLFCNSKIEHKQYTHLNDCEIKFLEDLSKELKCDNVKKDLNIYLKDIFCIKLETTDNLKDVVFYTNENHYCAPQIYSVYNFIGKYFREYLKFNNISKEELTKKLYGDKTFEEEDEYIEYLLNLTVKELVQKYSMLICK